MNRSPSSVSVIVPTFNRAPLLGRALDSLLAQSRPCEEIVVVDDGSSDQTAELMRESYPGLGYLRQENRGVSAARNLGIHESSGEWLAFLDSDDQWLPDKLKKQLRALQTEPDLRVCHSDEIWIRNGRRVNPMKKHAKYGGWIFARCLPLCCVSPSSVLIHRSVFDEVGLFDESLPACEDYEFWLRVSARYPLLYVDEKLIVKYGGHPDQLSHKYWGMDRFRIQALEKILASGTLSEQDREAASAMLKEKLRIYRQGARKRGRSVEPSRCEIG
ncbi:MAG: glycosyltransferase family 2 protein [Candidatus Binatia bacterium]